MRKSEINSEDYSNTPAPWQRIEAIIRHYQLPSISAFARELGLNRAENLYQIKRGNNRISRELADTIHARFPEISKGWLLTGEGAMHTPDDSAATIPEPDQRPPDKIIEHRITIVISLEKDA